MSNIESIFPTHFSQSVLADVNRCEVYFFRRWCQKFIGGKNSDLIAGSLFATACELTRKAYYNDEKDIDEAIEIGYNSILTGQDTGDVLKSNDRMAFLFKKYLQKYPLDRSWTPILLSDGTYSIEYEFEFDLGIPHPDFPDRNIHYSGKLDLLGEKRLAGGRVINAIIDEKTTKSVKRIEGSKLIDLAKEEESYKSSGQIGDYCWAAKQLGIEVEKAYIRRIPVAQNYEPAYELEIEVTPFFIENRSKSMMNRIAELAERYKYYKKTGDLFSAFNPNYDTSCNAFNRSCGYKIGCINKDGEDIILQSYPRYAIDPFTKEHLTIEEYLTKFNLK
jgi:hypothetical protein